MKINCLSCGHNIVLEDATYGDYEGAIKCFACGAILEVKLSEERIKSMKIQDPPGRAGAETKRHVKRDA
jgi:DNA-directed RNA polymerase subunit N (RpoN/RPB10)